MGRGAHGGASPGPCRYGSQLNAEQKFRFVMPLPYGAFPERRVIAARTRRLLPAGTSRDAIRTRGTPVPPCRQGRREDVPACSGSGVTVESTHCLRLFRVLRPASDRPQTAACHEAVESSSPGGRDGERKGTAGPGPPQPAGSVGPPQRNAPLTFVQGHVLLQSKPGPHHMVFRSPSSGSHAVPGCSGCRGRPAIVCRPPPRHEALDLRVSSPAVRHVGAGGSHVPARDFFTAGWE
ncbi:hypothetical protein NDU88_006013 [Pleurodeles waltl]|uniref:Uncharacterized protein n=1 Tax=Pleurodeles waltl TaxID=8319 RepID=A0AAV7LPE9_PLEWA|nr:hypothetical protein NDU88_006013 [Pleurodeles waltl]